MLVIATSAAAVVSQMVSSLVEAALVAFDRQMIAALPGIAAMLVEVQLGGLPLVYWLVVLPQEGLHPWVALQPVGLLQPGLKVLRLAAWQPPQVAEIYQARLVVQGCRPDLLDAAEVWEPQSLPRVFRLRS